MPPHPTDVGPFLYAQAFTKPPITKFSRSTSLEGQTVIVTGANTGLGFEAARQLVHFRIARLIIAVRSKSKGDAARKELLRDASENGMTATVDVWDLDLASYDSIIAFADRCKSLDRLDSVVCNAGISTDKFRTINGYESEVAVNVVSTLLVGMLVLPKLRETTVNLNKDVKLVFTGSAAHKFADPCCLVRAQTGDILSAATEYARKSNSGIYTLSKLMMTLAVNELAQREQHPSAGSRVIITQVHPGWCGTDLFRDENANLGQRISFKLIGWTTEQGGRTLVHAVTEAGPDCHGKFLSECKIKSQSVWARSKEGQETQRRLWEELRGVYEELVPNVRQIVAL